MRRHARYSLAALALAASAAPAPASACDFEPERIYFQPGSSALPRGNTRKLDIFREHSDMYGKGGRIWLRAHTDRVGDGRANLRLSRRRAEAVRDYLVRHGVPKSRIDIINRGEALAPFPTADETPEPRNNFVELELVTPDEAAKWRSNRNCG